MASLPFLIASPDGAGTGLVVLPQAEALPAVWAGRMADGVNDDFGLCGLVENT